MRIVKANKNTKEIIKWQQTIRITLFQMSARCFKLKYTSYGWAEYLFWLFLISRSRFIVYFGEYLWFGILIA